MDTNSLGFADNEIPLSVNFVPKYGHTTIIRETLKNLFNLQILDRLIDSMKCPSSIPKVMWHT